LFAGSDELIMVELGLKSGVRFSHCVLLLSPRQSWLLSYPFLVCYIQHQAIFVKQAIANIPISELEFIGV